MKAVAFILGAFAGATLVKILQLESLAISNNQNSKTLMANQEELTAQINQMNDQVNKIKGEVQNLITAVGNQPNVTPELQTAVDNLKASLQGVDDMNTDQQA